MTDTNSDVVFETSGVQPVKLSIDIQTAKKEKARLDREAAEGDRD